MNETHHGIRQAARRSGLSQDVIRAWEKRYQAVRPLRTATRRRMYGDDDIVRLDLLRRLTAAGHPIGHIAGLTAARLGALLRSEPGNAMGAGAGRRAPGGPRGPRAGAGTDGSGHWLHEGLAAVAAWEASELEGVLDAALVEYGRMGLLTRFVAPLAREIGERWRAGELTAAHEHFATAGIKACLSRLPAPAFPSSQGPLIVSTTPAGQMHELGAVMTHFAARESGWQSLYLGGNLPAAEIAGAALKKGARAVALSIVYPADDPALESELTRLRSHLPRPFEIIAGGRAASGCLPVLRRIGARTVDTLEAFGALLDALRRPARRR